MESYSRAPTPRAMMKMESEIDHVRVGALESFLCPLGDLCVRPLPLACTTIQRQRHRSTRTFFILNSSFYISFQNPQQKRKN